MNYQLSRRSFFRTSTAIVLTQLLSGCNNSDAILQILFLANSVPVQLIGDFRKAISSEGKVNLKPETQLYQTFSSLLDLSQAKASEPKTKNLLNKIFNRAKNNPNVVSLGDYWLASAVEQKLVQPLDTKSLVNWKKMPLPWQKLVRRNNKGNITDDGKIYGAPYRWGSIVIAYQSDRLDELGLTITDWQDLWNPKLRDRISLLDSPRETIGLTLKKLGYSYNTDDLNSIPELEAELSALHQQTKLYSSDRYLEPLILGDTWVAVGWSTDILSIVERYPKIKFVIPSSGTSLWADLWVKPRLNENVVNDDSNFDALVNRWIDFCWESKAAKQISLFTEGMSPILLGMKPEELPQDLQDNILINSEVIKSDQSEFLQPQMPETQRQYEDLWLKIRQAKKG